MQADCLQRERTYVVIQLLQHSLIQLDDKGASVPVFQDSDLCGGPFSGHLVQRHLNTGLLACYLRDLQPAYFCREKKIKGNTTPSGVNSMRSQVSYWAAQHLQTTVTSKRNVRVQAAAEVCWHNTGLLFGK